MVGRFYSYGQGPMVKAARVPRFPTSLLSLAIFFTNSHRHVFLDLLVSLCTRSVSPALIRPTATRYRSRRVCLERRSRIQAKSTQDRRIMEM
jgi:hypothetical protein